MLNQANSISCATQQTNVYRDADYDTPAHSSESMFNFMKLKPMDGQEVGGIFVPNFKNASG
jgi:hypothetical protein